MLQNLLLREGLRHCLEMPDGVVGRRAVCGAGPGALPALPEGRSPELVGQQLTPLGDMSSEASMGDRDIKTR